MSDFGNRPPDEPTRAYTPVGGEDDATRLERPIEPYNDERAAVSPTVLPPGYREKSSLAAPLIAVGLLCILIGIGLGYLLFHDSSSEEAPTTTTSSSVVATTTTVPETTTTALSTTTTAKPTTTTAKPTTTTAKPTTTVKPSTTTTLEIDSE